MKQYTRNEGVVEDSNQDARKQYLQQRQLINEVMNLKSQINIMRKEIDSLKSQIQKVD